MARPAHHKEAVITFKADSSLLEVLRSIPNRSEFIRAAILKALDSYCPLCRGTGVLTPNQKRHWELFSQTHTFQECTDCHEVHLICAQEDAGESRGRQRSGGGRASAPAAPRA